MNSIWKKINNNKKKMQSTVINVRCKKIHVH